MYTAYIVKHMYLICTAFLIQLSVTLTYIHCPRRLLAILLPPEASACHLVTGEACYLQVMRTPWLPQPSEWHFVALL